MVTLRVHIDPVPVNNAPLLITPGSHKLGRVPDAEARGLAQRCGTVACLAEPGDVWLYATPILHASESAVAPARRRVLQVDFSVARLPRGLEWLGI
jgi:ectoine hydroxylase-related dioxygenase (phytanoyl-CoA dioxygenase family)